MAYRTYSELSDNEKAELRQNYFYGETESGKIRYQERDWNDETDIPETEMESEYGIYSFTEEDFFCNTNENASKHSEKE